MVASKKEDAVNGQTANAVIQVSAEPATIAVSINKKNLTHEFIAASRYLSISVLGQEAPLSLIGHFGFKSGRKADKFAEIDYRLTGQGIPYITDHALAYLEAGVLQELDADTHTVFLGRITEAEVLKEGDPMTYAYYHQIKRGTTPSTAPTYISK